MGIIKSAPLSVTAHAGMLRSIFKQGKLIRLHPNLEWSCSLKPTSLSIDYEIKLYYKLGVQPDVYVIKPQLQLDENSLLPHVYSTRDQHLCLHYPPEKKWHSRQHLALTIVPWTAEWLFHYEIWLMTGVWNGGGTFHDSRGRRRFA